MHIIEQQLFYKLNVVDMRQSGAYVKVQIFYIVGPKVDQWAGLLSLPHLGIFAIHTR